MLIHGLDKGLSDPGHIVAQGFHGLECHSITSLLDSIGFVLVVLWFGKRRRRLCQGQGLIRSRRGNAHCRTSGATIRQDHVIHHGTTSTIIVVVVGRGRVSCSIGRLFLFLSFQALPTLTQSIQGCPAMLGIGISIAILCLWHGNGHQARRGQGFVQGLPHCLILLLLLWLCWCLVVSPPLWQWLCQPCQILHGNGGNGIILKLMILIVVVVRWLWWLQIVQRHTAVAGGSLYRKGQWYGCQVPQEGRPNKENRPQKVVAGAVNMSHVSLGTGPPPGSQNSVEKKKFLSWLWWPGCCCCCCCCCCCS